MYDLIVIGSGPGGYVAAIRASQLGLKTAIIEKSETLGGTCLNVGCIPSKALLDSSHRYHDLTSLAVHGIGVQGASIDWPTMQKRKELVVSDVTKGVAFLMKKNSIEIHQGTGSLLPPQNVHRVLVQKAKGGEEVLEAKRILLATGSQPVEIPGMAFNGETIISSTEALSLQQIPHHLMILGAGVIGLEIGSVYARLGSRVTILEMLPGLLPGVDARISTAAKRSLEKLGITFHLSTKVTRVDKADSLLVTAQSSTGEEFQLEGSVLLVAAGRKPYTAGLGLEKAGLATDERGFIPVQSHSYQTSVPGIYAIGDVIRGPMLAHRAEDEGIAVAEILAGQKGHVNYNTIPFVVYTHPEIAWIGSPAEELKSIGIPFRSGVSFYKANGRARASEEREGMVLIHAHEQTDEVLGAAIFGAGASELIQEIAVAMEYKAASEDIARIMHAHPTMSEVIRDAAQATTGWAIHQ